MARSNAPKVEIGYSVARSIFETADDLAYNPILRLHIKQHNPGGANQIHDQLAITHMPTMPITGSIQTHPSAYPVVRPITASTDTAASATT